MKKDAKEEQYSASDYAAADVTSTSTRRGIVALVLSALVCIGTVWGIFTHIHNANKPAAEPTQAPTQQTEAAKPTQTPVEPANSAEGIYNILLAGTDDGDMQVDTLHILQIDTATENTAMLSIPRETLIFGNYSVPKISTVYGSAGKGEDGAKALVLAVKDLVGFQVDGYLLMSPADLRKTVDALGGVDFNVPQEMYVEDDQGAVLVDLDEGEQHMDGTAAIQLMRYRDYDDENTERAEVQRDFITAMIRQFQTAASENGLESVTGELTGYLMTDMDAELLQTLAQQLSKCDMQQLQGYTVPGENVTIKGAEYYQLDEEALLKLINEELKPVDRELTKYDVAIRTQKDFGNWENVPTVDDYTASQQNGNNGSSGSSGSSDNNGNGSWGNSGNNDTQTEPTDPIPDTPPETEDPTDETDPTDVTDETDATDPTDATDETDPTDSTDATTDTEEPTQATQEPSEDPTQASTDAP